MRDELVLAALHFARYVAKPLGLVMAVFEDWLREVGVPMRAECTVQLLQDRCPYSDLDAVDLFHDQVAQRSIEFVQILYIAKLRASHELARAVSKTCGRLLHEGKGIAAEAEITDRTEEFLGAGDISDSQAFVLEPSYAIGYAQYRFGVLHFVQAKK
jgi:hypothetical protein